eukprot:TRINITY_DN5492_c1_g1_i4.p1 TRINITY_DN5492_c1_g1~~TRINITY_DN5492_c1_g1_i4.p1  ORF type:complete len:296 (+),score=17.36 TRINITY_DN5492_c1_g1_i4:248-1135(+)
MVTSDLLHTVPYYLILQFLLLNILIKELCINMRWLLELVWEYILTTFRTFLSLLFSKQPNPPELQIEDVRCNRVKLKIIPHLSSKFNIEIYEPEFAPMASDNWTSMGRLEHVYRIVGPLESNSMYQFRVRALNRRGVSRYSDVIKQITKIVPIQAGAILDEYTWTQTATEVVLALKIDMQTRSRDVSVKLQGDELVVKLRIDGLEKQVLQGVLSRSIRNFDDGSVWELVTEKEQQRELILTLEKKETAASVKFDFWENVFRNHPKIDRHAINQDHYQIPKKEVSLQDWVKVGKEE